MQDTVLVGSKYNFLVENEGTCLVYNTLYPALWEVDRTLFDFLKQKEDTQSCPLDADLKARALQAKLLCPAQEDQKKTALFLLNKAVFSNDLFVSILPARGCNFRCVYCFEDHKNESLTDEGEKRICRFFKRNVRKFKSVKIDWFGGEPLLEKDRVISIMQAAQDACEKAGVPLYANIITNGYLLDLDTFLALTKTGVLFYQITIDGPAHIHNRYRPLTGGGETYDRIIQNLLEIHRHAGNSLFSVAVRTNLDQDTISEYPAFRAEMQRLFENDPRFRFSANQIADWGGEDVRQMHLIDDQTGLLPEEQEKYLPSEGEMDNSDFMLRPLHERRCHAGRYYGFAVAPDLTVHKCTNLSFNTDKKDSDQLFFVNECGYIAKNGSVVFDDAKLAAYMQLPVPEEQCGDCAWMPYCTMVTCPNQAFRTGRPRCMLDKTAGTAHLEKEIIRLYKNGRYKKI